MAIIHIAGLNSKILKYGILIFFKCKIIGILKYQIYKIIKKMFLLSSVLLMCRKHVSDENRSK